jgi:hypothetical protein
MAKNAEIPNVPDAYNIYLADLIGEIEAAGCCLPSQPPKQLTWVGTDGVPADSDKQPPKPAHIIPISFEDVLPIPPTPQIFETLDEETLTNIRWGVQIYLNYLAPLGAVEIKRRANSLYALAEDATKNWGEDVRSRQNIERHLIARTVANRNEALEKDAYLHFYVLMLMQIGMLQRQLHSGSSDNIIKICHQIDLSHTEAINRHRPYREKERAARKRARALHSQNNAEPKMYALMRYPQLCGSFTPQGKERSKSQIADIIIKELKELCKTKEIKGSAPTKRVLTERWLPKTGK